MSAEVIEARPSRKVRQAMARLHELNVRVEALPTGAFRLSKGLARYMLVARLEYLNEDDFLMFAGARSTISVAYLLKNAGAHERAAHRGRPARLPGLGAVCSGWACMAAHSLCVVKRISAGTPFPGCTPHPY